MLTAYGQDDRYGVGAGATQEWLMTDGWWLIAFG
jgi:hypothetical protein